MWKYWSLLVALVLAPPAFAEPLKTWDGKHSIEAVEVTAVYFVPSDREPLGDWRERVDYFAKRLEDFHAREFQGQSKLTVKVEPQPFRSKKSTAQLRAGDGDFTFFQTLGEVDRGLEFEQRAGAAFPILLVLSEINWRPLDDFYRLSRSEKGIMFEGTYGENGHFPGAASGGARATFISAKRKGWGLVSADGWRVPYRGADCVVYHEGVGHSIGLPHPEPGDNSVMAFGQYNGWINESWVHEEQKRRLGWKPVEKTDSTFDLFTKFRAVNQPVNPRPNEDVYLNCDWPEGAEVASLDVRFQTDLHGPWIIVPVASLSPAPKKILLGKFDRPTPVSYRVRATLENGQTAELWGYFQTRERPDQFPRPAVELPELRVEAITEVPRQRDKMVDLMELVAPEKHRVQGKWQREGQTLLSPKEFGARIEIPYLPPAEYEIQYMIEPLDEPNALVLGQRMGGRRFVATLHYGPDKKPASALENIAGENVGNATTLREKLFEKNRPSFVCVRVTSEKVTVQVDGREIIAWHGKPADLSLSDYWRTPHDGALFIGAYDCRYRISRITLVPLEGQGQPITDDKK